MWPSATPATRSEGGCRHVPRLPRKVPQRHRRLSAPKRAPRSSPVPQVPRLLRETKVMSPSATPATRSEGGCRQVPAMPATHSAAASPATEHAQARPSTPPDPTQCRKCNACHAKRRWMSPSATPATQNEGGKMVCDKVVADKDSSECERWCVTKLWATKMVWMWEMVCGEKDGLMKDGVCERWFDERWCVRKLCVKDGVWQSCVWKMVCDKVVCERWCVKDGGWQSGVWRFYERWCVKDGARMRRRQRRRRQDTESKTRTPHKDVGKMGRPLKLSRSFKHTSESRTP